MKTNNKKNLRFMNENDKNYIKKKLIGIAVEVIGIVIVTSVLDFSFNRLMKNMITTIKSAKSE